MHARTNLKFAPSASSLLQVRGTPERPLKQLGHSCTIRHDQFHRRYNTNVPRPYRVSCISHAYIVDYKGSTTGHWKKHLPLQISHIQATGVIKAQSPLHKFTSAHNHANPHGPRNGSNGMATKMSRNSHLF